MLSMQMRFKMCLDYLPVCNKKEIREIIEKPVHRFRTECCNGDSIMHGSIIMAGMHIITSLGSVLGKQQ